MPKKSTPTQENSAAAIKTARDTIKREIINELGPKISDAIDAQIPVLRNSMIASLEETIDGIVSQRLEKGALNEIVEKVRKKIEIPDISQESIEKSIATEVERQLEDSDVSISDEDLDRITKQITKDITGQMEDIKKTIPTRKQVEEVAVAAVNNYMAGVLGAAGMDVNQISDKKGGFNLMSAAAGMLGMMNKGKAPTDEGEGKEDKKRTKKPEAIPEPVPVPPTCPACGKEDIDTSKYTAEVVNDTRVAVVKCPDCTTKSIPVQCGACKNVLLVDTKIKPGETTVCPSCKANLVLFS